MSTILSPVLHPASGLWMLGKIEDHVAKPLTFDEIEATIRREVALSTEVQTLEDDRARIDWIEHMAAECEGHILTRLFLPDGKPFREKVDAAMKLNPA